MKRDLYLYAAVGVTQDLTVIVSLPTYGPTAIVKLGGGFGVQPDVSGVARARNPRHGNAVERGRVVLVLSFGRARAQRRSLGSSGRSVSA